MPVPPLVEFRDVSKRFGAGPLVLDRLSFAAAPGDFISIIGPSGCGKSTLLRLIAGLSPITGGALAVDGMTPEAAAAELAFVFQEPTLLPWLTVARNVELAQKLRGVAPAERTATCRRVLELVRLADRVGAYPRQLSGGQEQRVAIARALVTDPTLLVADEPTGNLDAHSATEVLSLLQTLNRTAGKTVILVTHDPKAAAYASRTLHLEKGELLNGQKP